MVRGKFLYAGDEKFYVRGVTYGTFRSGPGGGEYGDAGVVERDLAQIAANGFNAIRTYTVPPRWLLDSARRHGLRVLVGLAWEQHVAFLDEGVRSRAIEQRLRAGVAACAGHPAVLAYAVGNEIPAAIVRWHGPRRVERYVYRLYQAAKAEDPAALFTYVNYPTTEYLELPFLDLACFNVYLESRERLAAYLANLHTVAGDRPLIMAELGLDSLRHGEETQARVLEWQIHTAWAAGCAGTFVFAWTDDWQRGGYDIEEWRFGLTDRERRPKPALAAVRKAFSDVPFPKSRPWPRITVLLCSHNGARTVRRCLEGLLGLEYPDFDVVVVDDGSTDDTAAIAREHGFRVISTPHRGLGHARNAGLEAATGEIVAYIDDDAYPDPHWLTYLADTFLSTTYVGVGGPNLAPPGGGAVAECVATAPGAPMHVLLTAREAEHIPGCNMAFRTTALRAIGGFDPQFRTAGDDVDVCWRLQEQGGTLGFNPAAVVWHQRRNSVRAYWRQQRGYGQAEALLERKWPEKYNTAGHLAWNGRLYGHAVPHGRGFRRGRIYQGLWGSAAFQSVYHQPGPGTLWSLPTMPEWYLVIAALAALSALGALWPPLLVGLVPLALAVAALLAQVGMAAARATFPSPPRSRLTRLPLRVLTAGLHLLQPLARLAGRLRHGLTPWRRRGPRGLARPWPLVATDWSERWRAATERLGRIEAVLRADGACVLRGGTYDRWDLEVWGGALGAVRMRMAVEEHGGGRQLVRLRAWPRCSPGALALVVLFGALTLGAGLDRAWAAVAILGSVAGLLAGGVLYECARATATVRQGFRRVDAGVGS